MLSRKLQKGVALWAVPISRNMTFFVFMFLLGYLCTRLELMPYYLRERGAKPYELTVPELFLDLYAVCTLLSFLPLRLRRWVRALLYLVLYGTALADVYCYVRFQSTLTPTMLMLVGETTGQEAGEFLRGYLSWDVVTTAVGWVLLLMAVHLLWTLAGWSYRRSRWRALQPRADARWLAAAKAVAGIVVAGAVVAAVCRTWDNKAAICRTFSYDTIGQVEHERTRKDKAELYLPVYRLAFSLYANRLAARQIDRLVLASDRLVVDSCTFRVPNIVLIIGESYNKHHSQLYGYDRPTTPRQTALEQEGSLVVFTDVVAPWNLTSYVFKNLLSLHAVGDEGEWCDYPLFPEVFRKAGYHVTFITNQFQSKANEAVYDFSGGFFLNNATLSKAQFDSRNSRLHRFDEGVLTEYDRLKKEHTDHNLVILHLMGSHVMYQSRYPQKTRSMLKPDMYYRPELTAKQRQILADYDNSLRYNDSIVAAVTQRFTGQDAVIISLADHGEEIFDGKPYMYGRMHGANIDYRLARNEMEIPFWIWGSPQFIRNHPAEWEAIRNAKDRPMMTDVLPHLLLYLGGIHTPDYRSTYNIISPDYDTHRERILKGTTDYNQLRRE